MSRIVGITSDLQDVIPTIGRAGWVADIREQLHPGSEYPKELNDLSLTFYLNSYQPTKALFQSVPNCPSDSLIGVRRRKRGAPLRVPPQAGNPSRVGMAFDYWFRAWLARTWPAIPRTEGKWIAEYGLDYLTLALDGEATAERARARMAETMALYAQYIAGDHSVLADYLRSCLFKANLDYLYRAPVSPDELDYFSEDPRDLVDLHSLVELTQRQEGFFDPRSRLILNPSFGDPSILVGGADADILLDDTLLEIKVHGRAKSPQVQWVRQLVGYWLLSAMNGGPEGITHIGLYLARNGEFYRTPMVEIAKHVDLVDLGERFLEEVHRLNSTVDYPKIQAFKEHLVDAVAKIK